MKTHRVTWRSTWKTSVRSMSRGERCTFVSGGFLGRIFSPPFMLTCAPVVPSSPSVLQVQSPLDAQINMKLQNILMLLKRCCNHPYLVAYPLDPVTQQFKVTCLIFPLPMWVVTRFAGVYPPPPVCLSNLCRSMNSWCKALGNFSSWTECCRL